MDVFLGSWVLCRYYVCTTAVLSAYKNSFVPSVLGMSDLNMLYSLGANTDPCGIPNLMSLYVILCSTFTLSLLLKYWSVVELSLLWSKPESPIP